jgi:hypothetical protein
MRLGIRRKNFGDHGPGNVIWICQHQVKVAVAVLGRLLFPSQQHGLDGRK